MCIRDRRLSGPMHDLTCCITETFPTSLTVDVSCVLPQLMRFLVAVKFDCFYVDCEVTFSENNWLSCKIE